MNAVVIGAQAMALLESLAASQAPSLAPSPEATELVTSGFLIVGQEPNADGVSYPVTVTDAGREFMARQAAPTEAVVSEITSNVPMPEFKETGSPIGATPKYPFADLEVGQSFHVSIVEGKKHPAKRLVSTVGAANKRFLEPVQPLRLITKTRKVKDDTGVKVEKEVQVVVMRSTRKFKITEVDGTDPNGPGARIFRVNLSPNPGENESEAGPIYDPKKHGQVAGQAQVTPPAQPQQQAPQQQAPPVQTTMPMQQVAQPQASQPGQTVPPPQLPPQNSENPLPPPPPTA